MWKIYHLVLNQGCNEYSLECSIIPKKRARQLSLSLDSIIISLEAKCIVEQF